jgi:hypothetical protein
VRTNATPVTIADLNDIPVKQRARCSVSVTFSDNSSVMTLNRGSRCPAPKRTAVARGTADEHISLADLSACAGRFDQSPSSYLKETFTFVRYPGASGAAPVYWRVRLSSQGTERQSRG